MRTPAAALLLALQLSTPGPSPGVEQPPADDESGSPRSPGEPVEGTGEAEQAVEGQGRLLSTLEVFFPDAEFDFRVGGLLRSSLLQGQLRYDVLDVDVTAFLRYRRYGRRGVYQVGVFNAIDFPQLNKLSSDFKRVSGALFLVELPHSYSQRTFVLAEVDRFNSNREEFRFTRDQTNHFLRIGHQVGTPNDLRSNSIVGETRAAFQRLFTAHQRIGPGGAGLTGALTYGTDLLGGDFEYLKLELDGLKRFDLTPRTLLVARAHTGSFLDRRVVRDDPGLEAVDRLSIPLSEYLRLDGRENLKGVADVLRGTEELHATVELFFPWFEEESRRALGAQWQTWYWVLYGGAGTIGFDRDVYTDLDDYVADLGFGFEASLRFKGRSVFVSGLLAHALAREGGFEGQLAVKATR